MAGSTGAETGAICKQGRSVYKSGMVGSALCGTFESVGQVIGGRQRPAREDSATSPFYMICRLYSVGLGPLLVYLNRLEHTENET
jgi:hypothetical protein